MVVTSLCNITGATSVSVVACDCGIYIICIANISVPYVVSYSHFVTRRALLLLVQVPASDKVLHMRKGLDYTGYVRLRFLIDFVFAGLSACFTTYCCTAMLKCIVIS